MRDLLGFRSTIRSPDGLSTDDAKDLTQASSRGSGEGLFQGSQAGAGPVSRISVTAVRHFLSIGRDARRALKRGGGQTVLPLEFDDGERRYLLEPVEDQTPEHVYERRWALTVLMGR